MGEMATDERPKHTLNKDAKPMTTDEPAQNQQISVGEKTQQTSKRYSH